MSSNIDNVISYWNINDVNINTTNNTDQSIFLENTEKKILLFGYQFNNDSLFDVSNNSQHLIFRGQAVVGGLQGEGNFLSSISPATITYNSDTLTTYEGQNFFPTRWREKDYSFS